MSIPSYDSFAPLHEMRYEDMYGDRFVDFVKSYQKKAKSGAIKAADYYVQFTNFRANGTDKTMMLTPDHSDPVGVYAYPLSYVLAHPSDIWYGAGAKNLRVLKSVSKRSLTLPTIDSEIHMRRFLEYLDISFGINPQRILKDNPHILDNGNGNKWAKLFFYIVQHDVTKAGYPLRSGIEQSRILKREFDAIIDNSKTLSKAVVNHREPEQICFLKRSAFKIVEVVVIHGREKTDIVHPNPPVRKLASRLALAMGDKLLTDATERDDRGMYWTVKGRRIEIVFDTGDEARDGLGMGQKYHRHVKQFDYRYPNVTLVTEHGTVGFAADYDDSYEDLAKYVRTELAKAKERNVVDPSYKPENKKSYEARLKEEEAVIMRAQWAEERRKKLAAVEKDFKCLETWAEMVGMPYQSSGDPEIDLVAVSMGEGTANLLKWKTNASAQQVNDVIEKSALINIRKGDDQNPQLLPFVEKTKELLRRIYAKYPQLTKEAGESTRRYLFHDLRD